jgi:DNA polymerase III subunit epsilon
MYAIVDIETTGGYASNNDITEICIVLHDGASEIDRFETLIRPLSPIPYYIQRLTGISHEMVSRAPLFAEVAPKIFSMLQGKVFIAHNVNFDYSFLKHHLLQAGFELVAQKVCTVRLSKKVFPGLLSYSLGGLCRHFGIEIKNRHRAGGDTDATVQLFELILKHDGLAHLSEFLRRGSREQSLPPNLPKEQVANLPYTPGVYYFHDQRGKIIYVGKAKNLKYRVSSHFTHNGAGRQRQEFLRNVYSITYQSCSTELIAFILESIEIKRLWPQYNSSQKRFTPTYALYSYEDSSGYFRMVIDKKKPNLKALYTFNLLNEGHRLIRKLTHEFQLCPKLCFVQTNDGPCLGITEHYCQGACEKKEPAEVYNQRFLLAVDYLEKMLPTFAVIDEGKHKAEQSCILIEKGKFYGMGYVPAGFTVDSLEALKPQITAYPENDYIRGLIYQYAEKRPEKKIEFFH